VAGAGNDHRLGASEAPPAIVSMFLGDELNEILDSIKNDRPYSAGEKQLLKVGVHVLPRFPKDTTDRNRTSPFAFTGNKFEFRMLGSSASVADVNTVLNTAVADVLRQFADELEGVWDFEGALHDLIRRTIREHDRIIFNGNGYDDAWTKEAEKRGLSNYRTTPDCLPHLLDEKNIALYTRHKVFSETELHARYEILQENYRKVVRIEALTMIDMARKDILPAVSRYGASLASAVEAKQKIGVDTAYERETAAQVADLTGEMYRWVLHLESEMQQLESITDSTEQSLFYKDHILTAMAELRRAGDQLESLTAADFWPFPTYGELLFGVR
jgi:glutamine synthetase